MTNISAASRVPGPLAAKSSWHLAMLVLQVVSWFRRLLDRGRRSCMQVSRVADGLAFPHGFLPDQYVFPPGPTVGRVLLRCQTLPVIQWS